MLKNLRYKDSTVEVKYKTNGSVCNLSTNTLPYEE